MKQIDIFENEYYIFMFVLDLVNVLNRILADEIYSEHIAFRFGYSPRNRLRI